MDIIQKWMSTDLLPCPFCGAEAGEGWVEVEGSGHSVYQIGCSEVCDCYIEDPFTGDAIRRWNHRAEIKGGEVEKENEILREAIEFIADQEQLPGMWAVTRAKLALKECQSLRSGAWRPGDDSKK